MRDTSVRSFFKTHECVVSDTHLTCKRWHRLIHSSFSMQSAEHTRHLCLVHYCFSQRVCSCRCHLLLTGLWVSNADSVSCSFFEYLHFNFVSFIFWFFLLNFYQGSHHCSDVNKELYSLSDVRLHSVWHQCAESKLSDYRVFVTKYPSLKRFLNTFPISAAVRHMC